MNHMNGKETAAYGMKYKKEGPYEIYRHFKNASYFGCTAEPFLKNAGENRMQVRFDSVICLGPVFSEESGIC